MDQSNRQLAPAHSTDTSKLLRCLAKLIEKPEIKAFQFSLIRTLSNIIAADSIMLYEVRTLKRAMPEEAETYLMPIGYEDAAADSAPEPMPLDQRPEFKAAFQSRDVTVVPLGDSAHPLWRTIYPIVDASGVTGLLAIDAERQIQRDQELALIFLGFYRDYMALLNDNQRDHLTGLLNRKSFDDKIMKMILSISENNKRTADKVQYCLALLDIDDFKRIKGSCGHLMGDEVLLHFSQCMSNTFRDYDLLFRVGGEEFVVVLRNVGNDRAAAIMDRFRRVVEAHYFPQAGQVTASIGVTLLAPNDLPVTVMDRADKALYYANGNGRNQVAFFEELVAAGILRDGGAESDVELF